MFWFVGRSALPPPATAAETLARQLRLARWFYRGTMLAALMLGLLAVLPAMFPRPHSPSAWARLWMLAATDATLKKALALGAVGLWLTALAFFRPVAEPEPTPAEPAHDLGD